MLQVRHTSQSLHTPNLLSTWYNFPMLQLLQFYNVTMLNCYNVTISPHQPAYNIFLQSYNFPIIQSYNVKFDNFIILQCSNVTSSPHEPILAHPPSWFQHFLQYCFKTVVNLFLKTEAHYRSMNHCTDPTYSLNMF